MKKSLAFIAAALIAVSCGPKTARNETGKFMPFKDGYGFVLPISPTQGGAQNDFSIVVTFEDDAVFLKSKSELRDPFISIMYASDNGTTGHETTQVSLDFRTVIDGQYVYSTGYSWFIPKSLADKVMMAGLYYAPIDVAIQTTEMSGPDGQAAQIPDFTGYESIFSGDDFRKYFKEFINHLN